MAALGCDRTAFDRYQRQGRLTNHVVVGSRELYRAADVRAIICR
jgi:hypothetical protein